MPVALNIKDDIKRAIKRLGDIEKRQIPFAVALAMTLTVKDQQREITREIKSVFSRPTSKTVKAVRAATANKRDWPNLTARVAIKDEAFTGVPVEKWLRAEIRGGQRKAKPFDLELRSRGLMPSNKYAVPARKLKLNRYGNVPRATQRKILASISASVAPGNRAKFFALPKPSGKLPAGIYQRSRKKRLIKLIFAYVTAPSYRRRLRFWRIADAVARQRMPFNFRRAWRVAQRTARR